MTLWSDFLNNTDGKLIHKWKHYFPIYERHFQDFVSKPVTFIEIGCGQGGSLAMWKRYFGPHARIIGIEDPQILAPSAPNYWQFAWSATRTVQALAHTALPPQDLSLAINSVFARTQNQLQIPRHQV